MSMKSLHAPMNPKCKLLLNSPHELRQRKKVKVKSLSRVRLCDPMDCVAYRAPPSVGFSRQEYWSGLPFPSPGDLPNPVQPVHSEGDQPWDFFARNDAKAETPVLWPPHAKG